MRILLTGARGQLGRALKGAMPASMAGQAVNLLCPDRNQLDLTNPEACITTVLELGPDWVINAAAYTAVDRAEQEPELAFAVNTQAPAALAQALQQLNHGRLIQISTDFVFNGQQGRPYQPDQAPQPLGVYGQTKAAGERQVLDQLADARRVHVVRTSWLYGPVGQNFLLTMLRLHRQRVQEAQPLGVVADQVGCPTSTASLAAACWRLVELASLGNTHPLPQILHWSDAGVASWYDFAVAIGELGVAVGLLDQAATTQPITTADYPTPATRPPYSLLDGTATRAVLGLAPQHWRVALFDVLHGIKAAEG